LRRAAGNLAGAGDQILLHFAGVILTDERQVGAVLFHERAFGRARPAVGVDHVDLRVPFPNLAADQSGRNARCCRTGKGHGVNVLHQSFFYIGQGGLLGHERFHDAGGGNPAKFRGLAESKHEAHDEQSDQDQFRASLYMCHALCCLPV